MTKNNRTHLRLQFSRLYSKHWISMYRFSRWLFNSGFARCHYLTLSESALHGSQFKKCPCLKLRHPKHLTISVQASLTRILEQPTVLWLAEHHLFLILVWRFLNWKKHGNDTFRSVNFIKLLFNFTYRLMYGTLEIKIQKKCGNWQQIHFGLFKRLKVS